MMVRMQTLNSDTRIVIRLKVVCDHIHGCM